jgi:hypothetical protein
MINKPYLELCQDSGSGIGLHFDSNSSYNVCYNLSSVASSDTGVQDDGVDNLLFPENNLPVYGKLDYAGGSGNQTVGTGSWTKIDLDNEIVDVGGIVDAANSKIVIDSNGDAEGEYLVIGTVRTSTTDTKRYQVAIYKNGVIQYPYASYLASATHTCNYQVVTYLYLDKDDYIELYFEQDSGGNETVVANIQTQLYCVKQNSKINTPFNR